MAKWVQKPPLPPAISRIFARWRPGEVYGDFAFANGDLVGDDFDNLALRFRLHSLPAVWGQSTHGVALGHNNQVTVFMPQRAIRLITFCDSALKPAPPLTRLVCYEPEPIRERGWQNALKLRPQIN